MAIDVEAILNAALSLPADDRAALAGKLLESLELPQSEIMEAWRTEVEDRLRAYDEKRLKVIPGDELMRSLRLRYAQE